MTPPAWEPQPPHDCRVTARCFRENFGFRLHPPYDFAQLHGQSSAIDALFRWQNDERGGEGGERIQKVRSRPVFSLHVGRSRGATWFDKTRPPEGIVWLCGLEPHDERHKGRKDAYDVFAALETAGDLFPASVDYKALELSRRVRDAEWDSGAATAEARDLVAEALESGHADGEIRRVEVRLRVMDQDSAAAIIAVAVSQAPIEGRLSGLRIELTEERFLLIAKSVERGAHQVFGSTVELDVPTFEFPGGLHRERAFAVTGTF